MIPRTEQIVPDGFEGDLKLRNTGEQLKQRGSRGGPQVVLYFFFPSWGGNGTLYVYEKISLPLSVSPSSYSKDIT